MRAFVLEDDPQRIRTFRELLLAWDATFIESCNQIDQFQPPYDVIFLDHDLGGRQLDEHEDCGTTFARLIVDKLQPEDIVWIHSYNYAGAVEMGNILYGHCRALRMPYDPRDIAKIIKNLESRSV